VREKPILTVFESFLYNTFWEESILLRLVRFGEMRLPRDREYRRGIQTKLSLASGLLVLISLASFGLLSYFVTRRTLSNQMSERLISHAKVAAATLRREADLRLFEMPVGESAYPILQRKLADAKTAANLDNVILMGAENKVLADANDELQAGEQYLILKADKVELESVWKGKAEASLLYRGTGGRLYKAAYAPVMTQTGKVAAVLRVEASARFLNTINNVGFVLLLSALIITVIAALLGMLIARSIVIPIKRLVRASQRIANGDLDTAVLIRSRDEIGLFARTFNQMARNLKRLYEEVEERGRQIAELSASVAHEVRSPISAIQGFTELLEDDLSSDDPRLEYTADIKNEIKVLNSKIADFIHFAKPMEIEPVSLDIIEILESTLASMDKETTDSRVSVVTSFGSDLPAVSGDFEQLRGLFVNLVRNAVQAMDNGGGLIISANPVLERSEEAVDGSTQEGGADPNFVEIKIEDTGCGISPESMERAFEPFFTTKGDGTGLGLAIVKKIVDAHNGRIELESYIGQGTTARVFLPVSGSMGLLVH
jgi:signal transduction histidine kinase